MTNQIVNIFFGLLSFSIFAVFQALAINGIYYCFQGGCVNDMTKGRVCRGNVFYMISPSFFEKHRGKFWTQNLWGCVRCMASVHGTWTYWAMMLYSFDFGWWMVILWIGDLFLLTSLNYIIYKKL